MAIFLPTTDLLTKLAGGRGWGTAFDGQGYSRCDVSTEGGAV